MKIVKLDSDIKLRNIEEISIEKIYICCFCCEDIAMATKLEDGTFSWVSIKGVRNSKGNTKDTTLKGLLRYAIARPWEVLEFNNVYDLANWIIEHK